MKDMEDEMYLMHSEIKQLREKKMNFEEQKMKFEELKSKYEEVNLCNVTYVRVVLPLIVVILALLMLGLSKLYGMLVYVLY